MIDDQKGIIRIPTKFLVGLVSVVTIPLLWTVVADIRTSIKTADDKAKAAGEQAAIAKEEAKAAGAMMASVLGELSSIRTDIRDLRNLVQTRSAR